MIARNDKETLTINLFLIDSLRKYPDTKVTITLIIGKTIRAKEYPEYPIDNRIIRTKANNKRPSLYPPYNPPKIKGTQRRSQT